MWRIQFFCGKLEQRNKKRCLGGQPTREEQSYCKPQLFLQVTFGGCTIKWSTHLTNICQQLKHSDCISVYLIYAFASVFYGLFHQSFTTADWQLSFVLRAKRKNKSFWMTDFSPIGCQFIIHFERAVHWFPFALAVKIGSPLNDIFCVAAVSDSRETWVFTVWTQGQ